MAPKAEAGLPLPPVDLNSRALPLKRVKGQVFRIHRTRQDFLYFGDKASARFDDPLGQYSVLYAALRPEAAFAEVFLRRLSWMLIRELDLGERSLGEICCRELTCVDLASAGLRTLSCDNRIATETPYFRPQAWSRAFFAHPQLPDGIIYRSRHNPQFKCLALFDRCRDRVNLKDTKGLVSSVHRAWTMRQVAKYRLAIEPAT